MKLLTYFRVLTTSLHEVRFNVAVLLMISLFIGCTKTYTEKKKEGIYNTTKVNTTKSYSTIKDVAKKLNKKYVFNSSIKPSVVFVDDPVEIIGDEDVFVAEVIQPLANDGQSNYNYLLGLCYGTQEWNDLPVEDQQAILNISSSTQLADLEMIMLSADILNQPLDGIQTSSSVGDVIHDCIGVALGIYGLRDLITNIGSVPTATSAVRILKFVARRYISYLGIAWMIWDFYSCVAHFNEK